MGTAPTMVARAIGIGRGPEFTSSDMVSTLPSAPAAVALSAALGIDHCLLAGLVLQRLSVADA
jgi:hypothetical protein